MIISFSFYTRNDLGLITQYTDHFGAHTYSRDELNRVNRETFGNGDTIWYDYDTHGNITNARWFRDSTQTMTSYAYTYEENDAMTKMNADSIYYNDWWQRSQVDFGTNPDSTHYYEWNNRMRMHESLHYPALKECISNTKLKMRIHHVLNLIVESVV